MLAPVEDPHFQTLLHRVYAAVDVPAFWAAVKSLLNEALPHHRSLTNQEKALLRALHPHVEATVRQVTARELGSRDGDPRRMAHVLAANDAEVQALLCHLTPAERDIVELLREGWSNKEIACELEKSIRTVKTQLTSVYKKFGVRSRSKLLARF